MKRRSFVQLGCMATASLAAPNVLWARMRQQPRALPTELPEANFTLQIGPVMMEYRLNQAVSTIGYNGRSPGPLIRMREGAPVSVDVINDTDVPELVHWHGLLIPSEVDGAEEEETPMVLPHGRRRYQFTPRPSGLRWYHTHAMAGADLHRGTYTGQFGFVYVEPADEPGRYDQELFLALRDWEPYFTDQDQDQEGQDPNPIQSDEPQTPDTRPNGVEIGYRIFTINDKSLGSGDPIRVRTGQRVLFHLLNASATSNHRIAMAGHRFRVVALDGNAVPSPQFTDVIAMGPGERVSASVEMNESGVWILGATNDDHRNAGMGVVVEYANQNTSAQWVRPPKRTWDYTLFGTAATQPVPAQTISLVIEKIPGGPGHFNRWLINGKEYPHEREFLLQKGLRYRLVFWNRTDDVHPVHMHRHLFELVDVNGKATGGIMKDTVMVPNYGRVAVDLVADQPGLTLFHCHNQVHMDFGFKALFRYL